MDRHTITLSVVLTVAGDGEIPSLENTVTPLSDVYLRKLKAGDKPKPADGGGLYLFLSPAGGMLWRMNYRFQGKRKTLSFGPYPAVTLKDARARREEAKAQLVAGVDPSAEKKRVKVQAAVEAKEAALTFEAVAREWFERKTVTLTDDYRKQIASRLENHLFPYIGGKPCVSLESADILGAVRHTEERGAVEMAHRFLQLAGKVCHYARLCGYAKYDAAAGLNEALQDIPKTKHRAALVDPAGIGGLLRAIDAYDGEVPILYALRILPYVFVRSQELRGAAWDEIDLDAGEWVIPAGRMKMKKPHTVPLSRQVVRMLRELKGHAVNEYLFPSSGKSGFITAEGLLKAVRAIGYDQKTMSVHGFRAIASTLLNESQKYRPDVIEYQLAHKEKDTSRAPYNRASYDEERRQMMQEWADYLDSLRAGE